MDQIREAFQKVKQEMNYLTIEIEYLKLNLAEINWRINKLTEELKNLKKPVSKPPFLLNLPKVKPLNSPTYSSISQTHSTHPSTASASFEPLKDQNLGISTGNEGVPTDRQTHQQTDRHIENTLINSLQQPIQLFTSSSQTSQKKQFLQSNFQQPTPLQTSPPQSYFNNQELSLKKIQESILPEPTSQKPSQEVNSLQNAAQILDSLDALKKEIRLKFKRLTEREILVFSALYQLE